VILDTSGVSAFAEGEPAIEPLLREATQIAVPVIVLGEYRHGIARSRDRRLYEEWLTAYLSRFRILPVDEETTIFYRNVRTQLKRAGTPIPSNDVWIAALCRQHRLPLLSRDRHFDAVPGIRRLAW
jgi:predicted nucleic acid-binding protein